MTTFSQPNAPELISKNRAILKRGAWGNGTDDVSLMRAMVPGAKSHGDCVTVGWPEWLSRLNNELFDAEVGASCEDTVAFKFAEDMAEAVSVPFDTDRALTLFLIKRMADGEHSILNAMNSFSPELIYQIRAVLKVVELLRRKLAGEDVEEDLKAAATFAISAATTYYAINAMNAADTACAPNAIKDADTAYAINAAYIAYSAAYGSPRAAGLAAAINGTYFLTARSDLIEAITEAQLKDTPHD